jgi:hypothetical protein
MIANSIIISMNIVSRLWTVFSREWSRESSSNCEIISKQLSVLYWHCSHGQCLVYSWLERQHCNLRQRYDYFSSHFEDSLILEKNFWYTFRNKIKSSCESFIQVIHSCGVCLREHSLSARRVATISGTYTYAHCYYGLLSFYYSPHICGNHGWDGNDFVDVFFFRSPLLSVRLRVMRDERVVTVFRNYFSNYRPLLCRCFFFTFSSRNSRQVLEWLAITVVVVVVLTTDRITIHSSQWQQITAFLVKLFLFTCRFLSHSSRH